MKAYLAANYMSGPKADAILSRTSESAGKKKKKRKAGAFSSSGGPSFIKDDDVPGWGEEVQDAEDETAEAVFAEDRGFKKRQRTDESSGWATVREPTPPLPADEQPQVVVEEDTPFKGGLLTSAQLKKSLPKKSAEQEALSREEIQAAQETIYRDATGRKIDTAAERAEAAKKKREREEQEAKKMEWGKGLVQREEVEKRRREEEAIKNQSFARSKDDLALNEELKAQERWNDPAAAFLTVRHLFQCTVIWLLTSPSSRKSDQRAQRSRNMLVLPHHQTVSVSGLAIGGMV